MSSKEILKQALELRPREKIILVEHLLHSIDEPDKKIDAIWAEEAKKRLEAYRNGQLKGIPMEEIFKNK